MRKNTLATNQNERTRKNEDTILRPVEDDSIHSVWAAAAVLIIFLLLRFFGNGRTLKSCAIMNAKSEAKSQNLISCSKIYQTSHTAAEKKPSNKRRRIILLNFYNLITTQVYSQITTLLFPRAFPVNTLHSTLGSI